MNDCHYVEYKSKKYENILYLNKNNNKIYRECKKCKKKHKCKYKNKNNSKNFEKINNLKDFEKINNLKDFEKINNLKDFEKINNGNLYSIKNKSRKNCDNNCFELIFCLFLISNILKIEIPKNLTLDFFNNITIFKCDVKNLEKYIKNYNESYDEKSFNKWINYENIKILESYSYNISNISKIYLTGKCIKFEEIKELTKNLKKHECVSDVYIKFNNEKYIGVSVKKNNKCQLNNISIACGDKDILNKFIDKFNEMGFNKKFLKNKDNRKIINEKLYNKNNILFKFIINYINTNPELLIKLEESINCINSNFDVFKYNGNELLKINKNSIDNNKSIALCESFFKTKNGKCRNAAKLFFKLKLSNNEYKVELRYKGSFTSSPQFLTFDI